MKFSAVLVAAVANLVLATPTSTTTKIAKLVDKECKEVRNKAPESSEWTSCKNAVEFCITSAEYGPVSFEKGPLLNEGCLDRQLRSLNRQGPAPADERICKGIKSHFITEIQAGEIRAGSVKVEKVAEENVKDCRATLRPVLNEVAAKDKEFVQCLDGTKGGKKSSQGLTKESFAEKLCNKHGLTGKLINFSKYCSEKLMDGLNDVGDNCFHK